MRIALLASFLLVTTTQLGCSDDAPAPSGDAGMASDAALIDGAQPDANEVGEDAGRDATIPPADLGPRPDAYVPDAAANLEWLDTEFCTPTMRALCESRAACSCADESIDACLADFSPENCVPEEFRSAVASADVDINRALLTTIRESVASIATSCRIPSFIERAMFGAFYLPIELGGDCPRDSDYFPCGGGDGVCQDGECEELGDAGEACFIGCKSGLHCNSSDRCAALLAAGEACFVSDDCIAGAVCSGGVCKVTVATGETCDGTHLCGEGSRCVSGTCSNAVISCAEDAECFAGESCIGEYASECRAPGGVGARCSYIDECDDGLGCDTTGSSWGVGECVPLPANVGDDCSHTSFCSAGLSCANDTYTCILPPGLGEECRYGNVVDQRKYVACATGLACSRGACQFAPGVGEPCDEDGICTDGTACQYDWREGGTSVCVVLRGEGEECLSDDVCMNREFYFCEWARDAEVGTCTRRRGIGEECTGGECEGGLSCIYAEDDEWRENPGVCSTPPGVGEACNGECGGTATCVSFSRNAHCVSSLCSDGSGGGPSPGPGPDPIPL